MQHVHTPIVYTYVTFNVGAEAQAYANVGPDGALGKAFTAAAASKAEKGEEEEAEAAPAANDGGDAETASSAEDEAAVRTALKAKFDAIDTDNSGTVETTELMAAIKEDTELQRLFELAALNFRPFAGGEEFSFTEIDQIAYQVKLQIK